MASHRVVNRAIVADFLEDLKIFGIFKEDDEAIAVRTSFMGEKCRKSSKAPFGRSA